MALGSRWVVFYVLRLSRQCLDTFPHLPVAPARDLDT